MSARRTSLRRYCLREQVNNTMQKEVERMFQKTIKLAKYNEISLRRTFHNKAGTWQEMRVSFETTFSKADTNETFLNLPENINRVYESPHTYV